MTRLISPAGTLIPLVLLGLLAGPAPFPVAAAPAVSPAATDAAAEETTAMTRRLHEDLARMFSLPAALKLDPELRAEADGIAAAHLARMKQVLPAWIQEERRLQAADGGKPDSTALFFAVYARMLNELALWHLEPGDAAYEQATLAAITSSPMVCSTEGDPRFVDFASRITRVQAMPPGQRKHALATERRLLEAWGKPRKAVPVWPTPLPQDAAMDAIAQARAGGKPTPLALPPFLASELLAKGKAYQDVHWESRCAIQRWWLRASLSGKAAPADALNAFRYGTLITATDRLADSFEPQAAGADKTDPAARPPYPKMAQRFDVTGATTITRRFDAAGKQAGARISARDIKVRGIRGVRPVAFENSFDAPSLRYALATATPAKAGERAPEVFQMNWSLESSAQTAGAASGTSAATVPGAKP